jgi:hypothetical protein
MRKSLIVLGAFFAFASLEGCVVRAYEEPATVQASGTAEVTTEEQPGEYEAAQAPPPPQQEVVVVERRPSPHHVWIAGHWAWRGRWVWVAGHWQRAHHQGAVWVPGHWDRMPNGRWRWMGGHWQ